jgi:hypothetical protein
MISGNFVLELILVQDPPFLYDINQKSWSSLALHILSSALRCTHTSDWVTSDSSRWTFGICSEVQAAHARAMLVLWLVGLRKCGRLDEPDPENLCLPKSCTQVDKQVAELQRDATGGALNFWYLKPLNEQSVHNQLRTRYEAHVWTPVESSCESNDRNKKEQSFKEVKFLFIVEAYCDERNILKPSDGRSQGKTAVSSKVKSKRADSCSKPQKFSRKGEQRVLLEPQCTIFCASTGDFVHREL